VNDYINAFVFSGVRGGLLVETQRYRPEVAGSTESFGRNMAMGSTQHLTEKKVIGVPPGGKGGRCVGLTQLSKLHMLTV